MSHVLAIVGPTAVGKSRLGLGLARRLGGEIVNADALQVYRGFDIGTAKPSLEERREIRHHLIDVLDPQEPFSAGRFLRLAREAIADIRQRGGVPIVVGGSGFYLRALFEGLSPLPETDPRLRTGLRALATSRGLEPLRRYLEVLDPATATRLAPGDTQRTLRALEVAFGSGRPLSDWLAERRPEQASLAPLKLGLTLPRAVLYDRIRSRIMSMIEAGWVSEVQRLLDRGVDLSAPAFQAIGYRQISCHLRGEMGLDRALEETLRATRRYAKRQMTWFRSDEEIRWLTGRDPEEVLEAAFATLNRNSTRWVHG